MWIRIDFTNCTDYSHTDITAFTPYILVPTRSKLRNIRVFVGGYFQYVYTASILQLTVLRLSCIALQFIYSRSKDNAPACHSVGRGVKRRSRDWLCSAAFNTEDAGSASLRNVGTDQLDYTQTHRTITVIVALNVLMLKSLRS